MAPKKAAAATGAKKATAAKEPSHPAYLDMVKEAVISNCDDYLGLSRNAATSLKERNGSSRQEIKKYILANYKGLSSVPEAQFKSQVNRAMAKGVSSGALTQPKGPSGPVKLAKPADKTTTTAKPAATKKTATKTEKTESKPAAKKAAPTKKTAAPAKKASTTTKKAAPAPATKKTAAAAAKPKAKANTGKPRKTVADAVEKKEVTLGKTSSGRVTKSTAAPKTSASKKAVTKKAPAKKATPAKKAATPKKA